MSNINVNIKTALENTVLCRGGHGPKESYEYAERMETFIKKSIIKELDVILDDSSNLEERIRNLILSLEK